MATVIVKFTSALLGGVPIPVGNKCFDFCVWGRTCCLLTSNTSFLAPILTTCFVSTGRHFDISIEESDKGNTLFKGIDNSSIVDNFEILISLLTGFRLPVSDTIYNSLVFLATKPDCLYLFTALNNFKHSHFTDFIFASFFFSFANSDFTFQVGFEAFRSSMYSAFVLPNAAQRLYKDENISCLSLTIPP
jgi:hypothetical protein